MFLPNSRRLAKKFYPRTSPEGLADASQRQLFLKGLIYYSRYEAAKKFELYFSKFSRFCDLCQHTEQFDVSTARLANIMRYQTQRKADGLCVHGETEHIHAVSCWPGIQMLMKRSISPSPSGSFSIESLYVE